MSKSEQSDSACAPDPYEMWRQFYDANERAWSSALEQAMGTPEFGESSGKLLEAMLAAQKAARDGMRTYLETMNVPTREDIARLGELVVGLEEKVDQVVDRLASIEKVVGAQPAASAKIDSRLASIEKVVRAQPAVNTRIAARLASIEKVARAKPAAGARPATRARPATSAKPAGRAK